MPSTQPPGASSPVPAAPKARIPSIDPLDWFDDEFDDFEGPGESSSSGQFYTIESEMPGARFHRVALNGLPIRGGRPQDKAETDEDSQETYIDAMNFSLRHDTSDFHIPLVGGAMSFSAKRKVTAEIWSTLPSLLPQDMLDRPFGHCWTAGSLVPNVRMGYQTHNNPPSGDPNHWDKPDITVVTDENGQIFRFFNIQSSGGAPQFIAIPASHTEQDNYLAALTVTNYTSGSDPGTWQFKLAKKFGTTLVFSPLSSGNPKKYQTNPGAPTADYQEYYYSRCTTVTDRYGLVMTYNGTGSSLVPTSITLADGRTIAITTTTYLGVDYITKVTDPLGNETNYTYTPATVAFPDGSGSDWKLNLLTQVQRPEGQTINYTYTVGSSTVHDTVNNCYYLPYNLITITTAMGGSVPDETYTFQYTADNSRMDYRPDVGFYQVTSLPMIVSQVTLPTSDTVTFTAAIENNYYAGMAVEYYSGGAHLVGNRLMTVVDALGKTRTYEFKDATLADTSAFQDYFFGGNPMGKYFFQIRWGTMVLTHPAVGSATPVTETYSFDPNAAVALSQVEDYSSNTTKYSHDDTWDPTTIYPGLPDELSGSPYFFTNYGDPTKQTDALSHDRTFSYTNITPSGSPNIYRLMQTITDELNNKTAYTFDSTYGLRTEEKVTDPSSTLLRDIQFTYGDSVYKGFLTEKRIISGVASGSDLVSAYVSDGYAYVFSETIGAGGTTSETQYLQDMNGNCLMVTDPNGYPTTYVYDGLNRLKKVTNPDSTTRTTTYDGAGNIATQVDENGHETDYTYDSLNRLTKKALVSISPNITWQHTYNKVNSKLTDTDPNGGLTTYTYDEMQRLKQVEDALSQNWQYDYSGANPGSAVFNTSTFQPTKITDPRGTTYTTEFAYDNLYRTTSKKVQYSSGVYSTTGYTYDNVGNLTVVTDPLSKATTSTFDALNRVTQVQYADSTTTQTTYTPAGLALTETDQAGSVTTHVYDAVGRRVQTYQPDPATGGKTSDSPLTQMGYDATGNMTSLTDPLMNEWTYDYDQRNRRTGITEPGGSAYYRMGYDGVGNMTYVTDPNDHETIMTYDAANRLTTTTNPDSTSNLRTYDKNGNLTQYRDENGHNTNNTFDALNRMLTTIDGAGGEMQYAYDQVGNRMQVTDANSCVTQYTYDGLNRMLTKVDDYGTVLAATTSYGYNALNLDSRVDGVGATTEYTYDLLNRVIEVSYPAGILAYNRDPVGNLLSANYGDIRDVGYTYDKLNRVLTETSAGATQMHTYDAMNRIATVYGTSGRGLSYGYDGVGRLLSMEDSVEGTTSYSYDAAGNQTGKEMANGLVESRGYDYRNRLTSVETTSADESVTYSQFSYGRDPAGNVTVIDEVLLFPQSGSSSSSGGESAGPSGEVIVWRSITNTYDDANRLKTEIVDSAEGTVETTYEYDGAHNRLSKVVAGGPDAGTTSYVIGDGTNGAGANQIKSVTLPDSTVINYTYDGNGNRATKTIGALTDTYSYDCENRLGNLDYNTDPSAAGTYSYGYDYRGRRIWKVEPAAETTYMAYNGGTSIVEYTNTSADPNVEYVRGPGLGGGVGGLEYSVSSGYTSYPGFNHFNGRGDIVMQTDDMGFPLGQLQYEAFGTHSEPEEGGYIIGSQRANTKEEDATGLLNEGFRFRDLDSGTFITRDPLGFAAGPNQYVYVGQNPWTKFDPVGLQDYSLSNTAVMLSGASNNARAIYFTNGSFSQSDSGNTIPPVFMAPAEPFGAQWVVRKEYAELINDVMTNGYSTPDVPGVSPGMVAIGDAKGPYLPFSGNLPLGAPNFKGTRIWINIKSKGFKAVIIEQPEIQADIRLKYGESILRGYQAGQIRTGEMEGLVKGSILPEAMTLKMPPSLQGGLSLTLARTSQGLTILAVVGTTWRMGIAIDQSVRQGSPTPVVFQAAREAGGWEGALIGAETLGGFAAGLGFETGPGAILFGLAGAVAGGIAGYYGADWVLKH